MNSNTEYNLKYNTERIRAALDMLSGAAERAEIEGKEWKEKTGCTEAGATAFEFGYFKADILSLLPVFETALKGLDDIIEEVRSD